MTHKKRIIAICGSASSNSGNLVILKKLVQLTQSYFDIELVDDLSVFPHFRTEFTDENVPEIIERFRNKIASADGILICTPEYVFSIPSGLKNLIEWCVSTTVFSDKPIGLITASASGLKGHEELKLIMETVQTVFTEETTLLIQGVKGKINTNKEINDDQTIQALVNFQLSFKALVETHHA